MNKGVATAAYENRLGAGYAWPGFTARAIAGWPNRSLRRPSNGVVAAGFHVRMGSAATDWKRLQTAMPAFSSQRALQSEGGSGIRKAPARKRLVLGVMGLPLKGRIQA